MRRKIVSVNVTDVEKRRYPSKHYVYIIQVKWDDGSNTVIFRRYSKFFDFQIGLLESFPKEGGLKDPAERTIPFLPGKILFGRSHVREVAIKRLKPIDEYCSALVRLPAHISNSEQVLDFFESKPEDLNPSKEESKRRKSDQDINEISGPIVLEQYRAINDYTRTQAKELTIVTGQQLEVIEKHENGWWFVCDEEGERGWVPGVYLAKRDGETENLVTNQAELGHGEKYITTSHFTGEKDEVSFGAGVLLEVLQKNLEGWWYVSYQGKQGWAPASYLEKPADAVLRHGNKNNLSANKKTSTANRRSLPGDIQHSVYPSSTSSSDSGSSASPSVSRQRKHLQLTKTNSIPSKPSKEPVKSTISKPKLNQVQPPPKRSTLTRNSVVLKPQKPPPLPPAPKTSSDPVYEYFTSAPFSADIPHGISFERDKKVKVIEKSPGDWWYISMGDKEGWAPASHVKKVFPTEKAKSPPARPKLPSVLKKPAQQDKPQKPQIDGAGENNTRNNGVISHKVRPQKSPSPLKTSPKPFSPNTKRQNANATSHRPYTDSSTKFDFKSALNKAVSNQNSSQTDKKLPAKPKPAVISKTKPLPTSRNHFEQKKPANPSAPAGKNLKKPAINSKKPTQTNVENTNGRIDFRSVLKSSTNTNKPAANNLNSSNKKPVVPGKPVIPSKPGFKDSHVKAGTFAPEKTSVPSSKTKLESNFQSQLMGKGSKPVLKRFQQSEILRNQNRNNNKSNDDLKSSGGLADKVEVTVPNLVLRNCRVDSDDVITNGLTTSLSLKCQDCSSDSSYVAIADFNPENPGETGFCKGDFATLLENSGDWWYVKIKGKSGWVPCSYFEKRDKSLSAQVKLSHNANIPLIDDEPVYSEIYDNAGVLNNERGIDLYRVVSEYSGSGDSTVNVSEGDTVHLVEQSEDWCFVRIIGSETEYLNAEGWLPSHCLEKI